MACAHEDAFIRCVPSVWRNRCVIRQVAANGGRFALWGSAGLGRYFRGCFGGGLRAGVQIYRAFGTHVWVPARRYAKTLHLAGMTKEMLVRIAPALFVLLWSTGFIGTKIGAAGAEPFTFLVLRFALVLALLIPFGWAIASPKLEPRQRMHAVVVGVLVHAMYLGGVMWGMRHGMPASIAALITCLQPILTAVLSGLLLREVISGRHWFGLALGLFGAALVVGPKVAAAGGGGATPATIATTVIALIAITCGTIYQRRFATGFDLVSGAVWQYAGAFVAVVPLALLFETRQVDWTPQFVGALLWLVLVLSLGAISLLMLLIRENAVSRTSALFYLIPGVTAVMAYFAFGEQLSALQLVGLVVVSVAVLIMQTKKAE